MDDLEHGIPREGRYSDLVAYASPKYVSTESEVKMAEVITGQYIQTQLTVQLPL